MSMSPPAFQLQASNGPVQLQDADDWAADKEGGNAMYYKTKQEAEKRMGDLKEIGTFKQYRVSNFDNSQGNFWRVEMRNGSEKEEASGEWQRDEEGGKALYYKTKAEAEKRMQNLKDAGGSGAYRVRPVTNSQGSFWRVEVKSGGTPAVEDPVKEEPVIAAPVKKETPVADKKDEGPAVTPAKTPVVKAGKAEHKLGLTDGVGIGLANKEADVKLVKDKLVSYGFLAADKKDQASLETAIGKFQKDAMGSKKPDKKISAGGATARALTTFYTATVSDYTGFTEAQKDITVSIKDAPTSFATAMSGKTFNSSTTVDNVDIKAMLALQDRIVQIKKSLMGASFGNAKLKAVKDKDKAKLTAEEKKLVKSHIALTIKGIKAFQKYKKVDWWSKKKHNDNKKMYILTETTTKSSYKSGEVAPNDATYILLNEMEVRTLSWDEGGKTKKRTRSNFVKSAHNSYTEGISDSGTVDPEKSSLSKFKDAGNLDESRAKALKHSSQHEGNYDGINTFDRAVLSYGFIQFAGGNRSLEFLFARIKQNHPDVWQDNFAKYGIDVEYQTDASGVITKRSCRVIVHDPEDKKTHRGMDAEHAIKDSPALIGVLMRAAGNSDVQDEQISVAADKYVRPSEKVKLKNYKMKVLLVKDAEGAKKTVKVDIEKQVYSKSKKKWVWTKPKSQIEAYKKTEEYKTAAKAKLVTEVDLSSEFKTLTLGAIMKSEKERGALYGTYLNNPGAANAAFRDAIVAIIEEDGLTTVAQIKAISPDKLLRKAETKSRLKNHKERIKTARTAKDLKS